MSAGEPLLELRQVSVWYGRQVILRTIDLQIDSRESIALLGPNGAGKTTILRVLATLLRPNRGQYRAFGVDAWSARTSVCRRLGVVAHQPYIYPELSCRENLRFFGKMFQLDNLESRIEHMLASVGLDGRFDKPAASLSRGLLQRLNLARALLHKPSVLILDEPETGLDVSGREMLAQITGELRQSGGTVIFATHALDLADSLATRVVQVDSGRIDDSMARVGANGTATESPIEARG